MIKMLAILDIIATATVLSENNYSFRQISMGLLLGDDKKFFS